MQAFYKRSFFPKKLDALEKRGEKLMLRFLKSSNMRSSPEYGELLCNRFCNRYRDTIKLKINCIICKTNYTSVPANINRDEYWKIRDTYKCTSCEPLAPHQILSPSL